MTSLADLLFDPEAPSRRAARPLAGHGLTRAARSPTRPSGSPTRSGRMGASADSAWRPWCRRPRSGSCVLFGIWRAGAVAAPLAPGLPRRPMRPVARARLAPWGRGAGRGGTAVGRGPAVTRRRVARAAGRGRVGRSPSFDTDVAVITRRASPAAARGCSSPRRRWSRRSPRRRGPSAGGRCRSCPVSLASWAGLDAAPRRGREWRRGGAVDPFSRGRVRRRGAAVPGRVGDAAPRR